MARWLKLLSPLLLGLSVLAPGHAGDLIELQNVSTKEVGALVDGFGNGIRVNDRSFLRLDLGGFFGAVFPVIPLDNFTLDTTLNEIIAFAHRRPAVLVEDVPWTALNDRVDVVFDDEYRIPIHIWIIQGPFDDLQLRAANATVATSVIWSEERTGLAFGSIEFTDATNHPDAAQFLDFTCIPDAADIKSTIGHVPGQLDVYYVNRVDFGQGPGTGNGVWCGSENIIAMGRTTSFPLLAHELGHAFSLAHTNVGAGLDHFDTTDVMHPSSNNRQFLTEGQNFRAVYNNSSSINRVYDVRAGQPTRTCAHHYADTNPLCPAIQKRIWADGPSWPPN
jgi:hypothetical protein